jgi:4-hydroxybenzoate polyprenyltransferase
MVDRDDDLKIGMKTSAITMGRYDVMIVALCYLINITFMLLAGVLYAYTAIYFIALCVALMQAIWHICLIRNREREACFKAFRLNHWYGFAVFVGVFLHYLMK